MRRWARHEGAAGLREQLVRTEVDAVQRARVLLDGIEELWRARVDRIDDLLTTERRAPGDEP